MPPDRRRLVLAGGESAGIDRAARSRRRPTATRDALAVRYRWSMHDLASYLLLGAGIAGAVFAFLWIRRITDIEGGDDPWRFKRD